MKMTDIETYDVLIKGKTYVVRIGKVPNGWYWTSDNFDNPDGAFPSAEAALRGASAEISARSV